MSGVEAGQTPLASHTPPPTATLAAALTTKMFAVSRSGVTMAAGCRRSRRARNANPGNKTATSSTSASGVVGMTSSCYPFPVLGRAGGFDSETGGFGPVRGLCCPPRFVNEPVFDERLPLEELPPFFAIVLLPSSYTLDITSNSCSGVSPGARDRRMVRRVTSPRSTVVGVGCYFRFPVEGRLPPDLGLPASLRFARQLPSWFLLRGCFPPPSSGT